MFERHQHAPRCVYVLADSLDSILAACEDLLVQSCEPSYLLRLELIAITHVLQARRAIQEIEETEPGLVDQCVLFLTGTAALDLEHLRSGRSPHNREVISTIPPIGQHHLIGRQVPLNILAEVAGTMLDVLEAHFVLYGDEDVQLAVNAAIPFAEATPRKRLSVLTQ
jgi:hypothetical protein